jgi:hypothetical protein
MRFKSPGKRIALLFVFLLLMFVVVLKSLSGAQFINFEAFAFGACLTLSGCIRKRRKSTPGQGMGALP